MDEHWVGQPLRGTVAVVLQLARKVVQIGQMTECDHQTNFSLEFIDQVTNVKKKKNAPLPMFNQFALHSIDEHRVVTNALHAL